MSDFTQIKLALCLFRNKNHAVHVVSLRQKQKKRQLNFRNFRDKFREPTKRQIPEKI